MKREHKPLEMIHAEWHDVKKEDKDTRLKWLIKHQKMMLPYDINWEKLIECNRTGKWPIIAKPKPIKLPKKHEKLYEEIMADDVGLTDAHEEMTDEEMDALL